MFDSRAAKALASGDHITFEGTPGLRLVASDSTRTWTYRFKDTDGRMRQTRLGHWPVMSYAEAVTAWQRARTARHADPVRDTRVTVRDLAERWLVDHGRTVAPRTAAESRRLIEVSAVSILDRPASSMTRADAFDLINGMAATPVVASGLRRCLGAVWDYGLDSGRLPADTPNWWRLVLRGKLRSQGKRIGGESQGVGKRVLSEDEVRALLAWMPNFSRDVQDVLTMYLWTACRGSEIVCMHRDHISDGWWTIPREWLKMRRNPLTTDLRVPLVGRARAVVDRRLAASRTEWLFPSVGKSGHIEQKAVGVAVWTHMPYSETRPDQYRPRLPVTHWAPHDLRRTVRTILASMGCPSDVAEAILGHQLPGIEAVYNRHRYDAERVEWLTRLDARMTALTTHV